MQSINLPSILTPDLGLLFWMLLAFLVVFCLLAKFGFPVITKMVEERKAYIDVWMQPWPLSTKYLLCADFGRNDVESITEENNPTTSMQFNSPMAGINFLSSLGWHVISTFQGIDTITKKPALHYILEKDIVNESDIMKGISTKEEKKKEPKKYKFGKYGDDIY